MPRYVDLDKLPLVNIDVDTINQTAYVDIREVQQALRQAEAQTGEVAPVVHGHWVLTDCGDAMCSRCRESYEICEEQEHARAMMRYFAKEWRGVRDAGRRWTRKHKMKSRKGEFYIACYNHGDMFLRKKTGYIIDDGAHQYGMCRGEDGLYRITDLQTGALLNIPVPENYSIAQTYNQLKRIVKESGGRLDACRRKRVFREAARKIRAAHEAEERWNAMSEEERKENTRACIAEAKIVGEALLQKMREEYKK